MSDPESVEEEMETGAAENQELSEQEEEELEEEEDVPTTSKNIKKTKEEKKVSKPGIIYLSTVPPKMNVTQIRAYFSQFGEIHRSFLQPEKHQRKGKKNQVFTEGWIEFKKRRHAKRVAALLNNKPLGGKKKKQNYDFLWNIKYLPGLQWVHINERLAYERISHQQKMRAEISAAKREATFFSKSVSLNKKLKKGGGTLNKPFNNFASTSSSTNDNQQDKVSTKSTKNKKMNANSNNNTSEMNGSRLQLLQNLFQTE